MLAAIKLVVTENERLLQAVTKDTSTQPEHLLKSLEDFQQSVNASLTKLIEQRGDDVDSNDDSENSDDNGESQVSAKKKKK